jgi:hypothetical protein
VLVDVDETTRPNHLSMMPARKAATRPVKYLALSMTNFDAAPRSTAANIRIREQPAA